MSSAEWTQSTIDNSVLRQRLTNPEDQEGWRLVAERYGPPIEAFARKLGLSPEDAADARQDSLLAFAMALRGGRFDAGRGRLRDFLFGIVRHKVADQQARRAGREFQPVDSAILAGAPAKDGWDELWNAEWQLALRAQCLREAQAHFSADTYRLFHLKVIDRLPAVDVARATGRTIAAVDMATHHVRAFLREIYPLIAEAF